ncbi:MAG: ATP-binding protein [Candidatus Micrarchaeota archaeon]
MDSGFAKRFERKILADVLENKLASKDELVLVACSGGKDSTTVLSIMHKNQFNVEALHIDIGIGEWSGKNRANIRRFCEEKGITLHLASTRDYFGSSVCYLKSVVQERTDLNPCFICGVMKKWILNKRAKELGAGKLATGHNLDDEARTFVMNLINGNPELCLLSGPGRRSRNEIFVPRIKPLYFCSSAEIKRYSLEMGFPVLYERCPCSKGSFGRRIFEDLDEMERRQRDMKKNIIDSFLWMQRRMPVLQGTAKPCGLCGEPSRTGTCRTCRMLSGLRKGPLALYKN